MNGKGSGVAWMDISWTSGEQAVPAGLSGCAALVGAGRDIPALGLLALVETDEALIPVMAGTGAVLLPRAAMGAAPWR
jgi:hypothetical protein